MEVLNFFLLFLTLCVTKIKCESIIGDNNFNKNLSANHNICKYFPVLYKYFIILFLLAI